MRRYLTLTLLAGFFIWLPNAFADNQRGLSLDAPSQVRHVQNEGNVLLTLRVNNIQVQASWQVSNAVDAFAITNGTLSWSPSDESRTGMLLATVYVVDEFSRLNTVYANLTASAVISVKIESGELSLLPVPRLSAIAGREESLYTLEVRGESGQESYTIVAGNGDNYFMVDERGVLSVLLATVGIYHLSIQVNDGGSSDGVMATVAVVSSLSLSAVPRVTVVVGDVVHTLSASGGIGAKTYTLIAGDESFVIDAASGILSLSANAEEGLSTLMLGVIDERGNMVQGMATVVVSAALVLSGAPPLTIIASVAMSLHTFIASGGIGAKTYMLAGGGDGYFAIDAINGVLSLSVNTPPKLYKVTVQAIDRRNNIAHAVVTVGVSATLVLDDAPRLFGAEGATVGLHTFMASGGIGVKTYTIVLGNEDRYFTLGVMSGVLSLTGNATVGLYTLSVQVRDSRGHLALALATVEVLSLYLASPSKLYAIEGRATNLYTLDAVGGSEGNEYAIIAGNEGGYFAVDATSGVLSVLSSVTVGVYQLSVAASDNEDNRATASVVVEVVSPLSLPELPLLTVVVGDGVYTLSASGGIGDKTYTLVSGDGDYFSLDETDGVLSVKAVGLYTLTLGVIDGRGNMVQGVATVAVSAVLMLDEVPPLSVALGATVEMYTLSASGGIGVKIYTLLAGGDNYFSIDANRGVLSLLAITPVGIYTLSIQATDSRGYHIQAWATVAVLSLYLADAPRLSVIVGRDEALHTFAAVDAIGVKTYTLLVGNADYFSIDMTSGVLSVWSSATVGIYTLSVGVSDRANSREEASAVVEVVSSLSLSAVPRLVAVDGEEGHLYTLMADGGIGVKTYTLIAGNTAYFVLGMSSGALSLSSRVQEGLYTLTLGVADSHHNTVQALATVEVSAMLMLADAPQVTVIASVDLSLHTFMASGGIGSKTYTLVAGNNGDYFALGETSGILSLSVGMPVGLYTLTVRAIDEDGRTVEGLATVGVSAALSLLDAPPISVVIEMTVSLHTFVGMGGIGSKTYTLLADKDTHYFNLGSANGVLSLTGSAPVGFYTLSIRAIDTENNVVQALATVIVLPFDLAAPPKLYVIEGRAVDLYTLMVDVGARTYMLIAGNTDYFGIGANSGVLSVWSSVTVGVYTLLIEVRDGGNEAEVPAVVEVVSSLSLSVLSPLTLVAGAATYTVSASGGIGAKTYTLVAGAGQYFVVNMSSGLLSLSSELGADLYTLTLGAMDSRGNTVDALVTVAVSAALTLADAPRVTVIASVAMSLHTFMASGGIGDKTYTLAAGNDYFGVNATSGILSLSVGTSVGLYTLTVWAIDAHHHVASGLATVEVAAPLSLADALRLSAAVGMVGRLHTFTGVGGLGSKTYTLVAGNNDYFNVDETSGVLSVWSPTMGLYTLSVEVSDESGKAGAVAVVLVRSPLSLSAVPLLIAVAGGTVHLYTLVANDGVGAKTYTLVSGNTAYFGLDITSGVLLLSSSVQAGMYTLTLAAIDNLGNQAQALATVAVSAALMLESRSFTVIASVAMSLYTFMASGGIGDKTYTLAAGDEGYFGVNATSGVLSLSIGAPAKIYTLLVIAIDTRQNQTEVLATVEVREMLSLAVPLLSVITGVAKELYTLTPSGGIGVKTYTLVSGDEDFRVDMTSGVLSWQGNATVGVYTLSLAVRDESGQILVSALVEVVSSLSLSGVSSLLAIADLPAAMVRHIFVPSGGIGAKTYALVSGNTEYFAVGARDGVLSAMNAQLGGYTLVVAVQDSELPPNRVTVTAALEVIRNMMFVVGGGIEGDLRNDVWSSAQGQHWALEKANDDVGWAARDRHQVVSHNGSLYVLGGEDGGDVNDVWSSANSQQWTLVNASARWSARRQHQAVSHQGRLYVLGGRDDSEATKNDVWSSVDGKSWEQEKVNDESVGWVPRYYHQAVSHNGRLYVLGGYGNGFRNDVWSSVDGENWELEKANNSVGWSPRFGHQVVSHQGRLYVLGGDDYTRERKNDVWSSVDGKSWSLVKANNENADWLPRQGHQALSYQGRLYVLGGNVRMSVYYNDVWSSADGKSWSLVRANNDEVNLWARYLHEAVIFPPSLFLAGIGERLRVAAGRPTELHMFAAQYGDSNYTYSLSPEGFGFEVNNNGVLLANNTTETGSYTLTVLVTDGEGSAAQTAVWVDVISLVLADAPLLSVVAGKAMNLYTLTAIGGGDDKTYTLVAGNTDYFNIDEESGVLSVAGQTTVGLYHLLVQADDDANNTAQAMIMVEVVSPLAIAVPLLFAVAEGERELYTVAASGGIGVKTYTLVADEAGSFSVVAAGVLFKSSSVMVGAYTLTIGVMDERGNLGQGLATVKISAALALTAAPVFTVIASVAMSLHTFIASGGIGSKTYTLVAGDGDYFGVDAMSGVLSLSLATPVRTHTLVVGALDEYHHMAEVLVTVEVSASLVLADAARLSAAVGVAGSLHMFAASGGIGAKTYALLAGNERYFIVATSSGVLSWSAAVTEGIYTLSIQATDSRGHLAVAAATVAVLSLSLVSAPRLSVIVGREDELYVFTAVDAIGDKTYMLLPRQPDYFRIDAVSGALSVLSSVMAGVYTLTVGVNDSVNGRDDVLVVVDVVLSLSLLAVPELAAVAEEESNLYTLAADGGIGAKTYTLVASDTNYFAVSVSAVLAISAVAGQYTLTVGVVDARGHRAQIPVTVGVSAVLTLPDAPRVTVIASVAISVYTFIARGGIGDKTYTLVADDDSYFMVNMTSGVLSLTVGITTGVHTVTVRAVDSGERVAEGLATVEVSARLVLADAPLLSAAIGRTEGFHTFVAVGGIGSKTYTLLAGNDAHYFNLGSANGVLSLTGSASARLYTLSVQAIDTENNVVQALATVTVLPFDLAAPPKLYAIEGKAADLYTLMVDGGADDKTYMLIAGNRDYFEVDVASGVLSVWSSVTVGIYTLSVEVRDGGGDAMVPVVVEVVPSLSLSVLPLLTVVAGEVAYTISASGGIGTKTYTLVAGEERYIVVNMSSGLLSLSAELGADLYTLTVGVSDARGNTAQTLATVVISAALVLPDTSLTAIASVAMSLHTFMASGGIGRKTYMLVGDDEDYFGLGATSGVLSLSVGIAVGLYTLTVIAVDEEARAVSALLVVGISASLSLADAPSLAVIASVAMSVYMFTANGGIGGKTYILVAGNRDYLGLGETSGVLSLSVGTPKGLYTLTVRVIDARHHTAEALATVGISAMLSLTDAPQLVYAKGQTVSLHQFVVIGGIGHRTYTIVAGQTQYFNLDVTSGVLSSQGDAPIDKYTLSVHVSDRRGHIAQALATVQVLSVYLADAPKLYAIEGRAEELHTFVAEGGDEDKTYTLSAGREDYFSINRDSGVLSVRASVMAGLYTVSVHAIDTGGQTEGMAVVEVVLPLSLADVSLEVAIVDLSVGIELYTLLASGGIKAKTYTLVSGGAGYFEVAANGVLSVVAITVRSYTLLVAVQDGDVPPNRVMATLQVAVHREEIFVSYYNYGDYKGGLWSSFDGQNWQEASPATIWSGRTYHQMVAHQGRLYLLGGEQDGEVKNDVWSSVDGKSWSLVKANNGDGWSARSRHQAVSYQGRLYVLGRGDSGEEDNDVWSSVDGQEWSLETSAAAWPARQNYQAVAHHDRLYVLGGLNAEGSGLIDQRSDVWSSRDGQEWELVTLTASWSGRVGHQVVSHNGLLYLLGGVGIGGAQNDVWSSFAGRDWTLVTEAAAWLARPNYQAVSYRGRLYVLFGNFTSTKNVWSSVDGREWEEEQGGLTEFGTRGYRAAVFPPALRVIGTVERLRITVGIPQDNVYTMVAHYGSGPYTYKLIPEGSSFAISKQEGVLSFDGRAVVDVLTVHVTDRDGMQARTPVWLGTAALVLADAQITVAQGRAISLHTFAPRGGGEANTYTIIAGNGDGYFAMGEESGVLSALGQASVGVYTLSVRVRNGSGNTAQARGVVYVGPRLTVAVPLSLLALAETPYELHTFVATNGIGAKTYTLASHHGEFAVDANGMFSAVNAPVGRQMVLLVVQDSAVIPEQLTVTVAVAVVRNMMFVLGGYNSNEGDVWSNDVWSSVDGEHWRQERGAARWSARYGHQVVAHRGTLYLLGGREGRLSRDDGVNKNDVWSSVNGQNWSLVLADGHDYWSERYDFGAVAHHDRIYVMGNSGSPQDIWSSPDGKNWSLVEDNLNLLRRSGYQMISHHGRLYFFGGSTGVYPNNVWSSVDGERWSSVTPAAAWRGRVDHRALSYHGRLYMTGGTSNYFITTVWSSLDGEHWQSEGEAVPPFPRVKHQSLAYGGQIYVLGGREYDSGWKETGDVWSSVIDDSGALGTWSRKKESNVGWSPRRDHQAIVFPQSLLIDGVGVRLNVILGFSATELHTLVVHYGDGDYTYALQPPVAGFQVPNGILSFDDSVAAGDYTLTVRVNDGEGTVDYTAIRVLVEPIVLADVEITTVDGHTASVYTFMAVGGGDTKAYNIVAGNDDGHFTLNEASGVLSVLAGVSVAVYTLAVEVSDGVAQATANAVVSVASSLSWSEGSLLFALTGVAKDFYTVVADGGIGAKTYDLAAEADYFTLSPNGVLSVSGSVTVGLYTLSVSVVDSRDYDTAGEITVEIRPDLSLSVSLLFAVTEEDGELYTLSVSGGFGVKSYTLVAGSDEFTVGVNDGVLSWSGDATVGIYILSLAVSDDSGRITVSVMVDVVLSLALAGVSATAIAELLVGDELHTFVASGGARAKTYMLVAGNAAGYFGIGAASGLLSVVNATVGQYTLSVVVQDEARRQVTANAVVRVVRNKIFVSGGQGYGGHFNDVWSSWDNIDWTENSRGKYAGRKEHQLVVHNGRMYLIGGAIGNTALSDVWSSANGKDWERLGNLPQVMFGHQGVSYRGRIYLTGGLINNIIGRAKRSVWSSVDGIAWKLETDKAPYGIRGYHQLVVHNGRMYLMGGADHLGGDNKVYSSVDGKNWVLEKASDNMIWSGRRAHMAVSHRGSLYVMGGRYSGAFKDVWASADGKRWVLRTDNALWGERIFAQAVSYKGLLYVLGGNIGTGNNYKNDIWMSLDGVSWTITNNASWVARRGHQAVVFPPSLFLAGVGERLRVAADVPVPQLHTFAAQYGDGSNYTYSLSPEVGFNLDDHGVLSSNGDALLGSYTLTVWVRDGEGSEAQTAVWVDVLPLVLADAPLLSVVVGHAVSLHTFMAMSDDTVTYRLSDDLQSFRIDETSGVLSVLPGTSVGIYNLLVHAEDSANNTDQASAIVEVVSSLSLAVPPLLFAVTGVAKELHHLAASGGIGAKTYTLIAHAAAYFAVDKTSGVLSLSVGISEGAYTLTLGVMDERKNTVWVAATVGISAALRLTDAPLMTVLASAGLSLYTFKASGGIGDKTYSVVPTDGYLSIDEVTGLLYLPTNEGDGFYTVTVQVVDVQNNKAEAVATVKVSAALMLAAVPRLTVIASVAMSVHTFVAEGGVGVKTYKLVAGDPRYFRVDAASGVLSLSAHVSVGVYTLSLVVIDDSTHVATMVLLEVASSLSWSAIPAFSVVTDGMVDLHMFARGGIGAKTYTLLASSTEDLVVAADGVLSLRAGITIGIYTLSVRVSDERAHRADTVVTMGVRPPLSLAEVPLLYAITGVAQAIYTLAASGGVGDKTFAVVAGNAAGYFAVTMSGVLSLRADIKADSYILLVIVQDEVMSPPATVAVSVQVRRNQMYVLGGYGASNLNDVWSSFDGNDWLPVASSVIWSPRYNHQAVAFRDRLYVMGGLELPSGGGILYKNDVWSFDGTSWSEHPDAKWSARFGHQAVSHRGSLYVLGGFSGSYHNDVWSSPDGETWMTIKIDTVSNNLDEVVGWRGRRYHQVVVHNSRLYLLGGYVGGTNQGYRNDVWSSWDGIEWSLEKPHDGTSGWKPRGNHQVVSYQGRLYLLGGYDNDYINDAWSSWDGKHWEQVRVTPESKNNDNWLARTGHQVLFYQGTLYLMGGRNNKGLLANDVWSSVDGTNWSRVTDEADWTHRVTYQAVVFPSPLFLSGIDRMSVLANGLVQIHTLAAQNGDGDYTYSLVPAVAGFAINDGVLVAEGSAPVGDYTLTVQAEDGDGEQAQTAVRVHVYVPPLVVDTIPPLTALGKSLAPVVLYTITASGGFGAISYDLITGNEEGYFALDAARGELSLPVHMARPAGQYTLSVVAVAVSGVLPLRTTVAVTVHLDKEHLLVLGGNRQYDNSANARFNDVWSSPTGQTWSREKAAPWYRSSQQALWHQGKIYLLGGLAGPSGAVAERHNDIWSSLDGINWDVVRAGDDEDESAGQIEYWTPREEHQAVSYQGRIYVLGGYAVSDGIERYENDVWSSVAGEVWSLETNNAGWAARRAHQAVVHNGRMYVLGGRRSDTVYDDVWSSHDGKNWVLMTRASWVGRYGHQALSHQGRLYVLGGAVSYDDSGENIGERADVWSSEDGVHWRPDRGDSDAGWEHRSFLQALPHRGRIYVLGGAANGETKNDVWSSANGGDWELEKANDDGVTVSGWEGRNRFQALLSPPPLALSGVGYTLSAAFGYTQPNVHTFLAQYGVGDYTYSLSSQEAGFAITDDGRLSANDSIALGTYTLTVWVEDGDKTQRQTKVRVKIAPSARGEPLILAPPPVLPALFRQTVVVTLYTVTVTGGAGAITYTLIDPQETGYFMVGAKSGELLLLVDEEMSAGDYNLWLAIEDGSFPPHQVTVAVSVRLVANHIFVLGGRVDIDFSSANQNDVWSSLTEKDWLRIEDTSKIWPARENHQVVAHQGRLYVLGGSSRNDVWSSPDGKSWSLVKANNNVGWEKRYEHQAVSHNGRLYVAGGDSATGRLNDVWSSADGESWSLETSNASWDKRSGHQMLSYNGRLYVLGGRYFENGEFVYLNDVWSSVDGKNWQEVNLEADWPARAHYQAISHNGRLYVLGGVSDDGRLNDVWSSADGVSWSEETDDAGAEWASRAGHQVVSRDGLLYVMGGIDSDGDRRNDIWLSHDGRMWTRVPENANWPAREGFQAIVFPRP